MKPGVTPHPARGRQVFGLNQDVPRKKMSSRPGGADKQHYSYLKSPMGSTELISAIGIWVGL
jgi:hypothetical protein